MVLLMFKKLMNFSLVGLVLTFALLSVDNVFSQRLNIDIQNNNDLNFYKIQEKVNQEWEGKKQEEKKGFKQFKRWEYFWFQRTYPSGNFPEGINLFDSYQSYNSKNKDNNLFLSNKWQQNGPFDEPFSNSGQQGMGRVNAIRFNPNNQNEIWLGSASGGLWKSLNGGKSWSTFDFTQFLSIGVSDIGIAPSNPQTIYVSTGDMFGSTSNRNFYSIGVIKSTDGGNSWKTTNLNSKLEDRILVGRILINPKNENIVYVSSNKGIYKSIDGGENWEQSERFVQFMDMEFKPGNSDVIYASTYSGGGNAGVYVSTDAGNSWKRTLVIGPSIRIAIAVTPANPEKIYALAANTGSYGFNSLQVSTDSGLTWEIKSNNTNVNILGWYSGSPSNDGSGQGFYDLCIAASPTNENEIYTGGINIWTSNNGGETFNKITHWFPQQNSVYVHADQHDLVFAPDNVTLFVGNDGGIASTTNKGKSWNSLSKGLNITQFYRIGVSQSQNNTVIAGAQDNGTALFEGNPDDWTKVYNSDGMECIIDPLDPQRMYASMYNGSIARSNDGGNNFSQIISTNLTNESGAWVTPYVLNPQNPKSIYAGFINVWKSDNYGSKGSWKQISKINPSSTLNSLIVAPSDTNVIYAASVNQLFATYNGGESWEMIYTSPTYITYIAVDFNNPKRLWLSKSGYNADDKIIEIVGDSVVRNMTGNLPNVPVNSIVLQENSPDRLYIGTDVGVFVTDYNSAYWERFGTELPNVIVNELEIHTKTNTLYASTYGRGLWSTPLITCNNQSPEIEIIKNGDFCPGDTIILKAQKDYPNYLWSTGETTKEIYVTSSGAYSLGVNIGGCIARSEAYFVTKTQFDEISVNKIEDEFLCPDGELYLNATSGFDSYLWSDGSTTRTILIKEPGYFSVVGINPNGCVIQSPEVYIDLKQSPEKPSITQEGLTLIASEGSAYQWYLDGKRLFNETSRELHIQNGKIGVYTVAVSNEFKCKTLSDGINIVTSVDNQVYHDFEVTINNNPGNGQFILEFSHSIIGGISLVISDFNGREVYSESKLNDSIQNYPLNISHLSSGIYFVKISANNFVKLVKLVKI
jgi:photosystem II stability/assembly factor-like uncharacterized protein